MYHASGPAISVSAAEISRNFGHWQDRAIAGPVVITHHGRARVVLISAEHFATWDGVKDKAESNDQDSAFEIRLSTVLDHIGEGFFALDDHLRFTSVNSVACAFFGQNSNRLIGYSIVERFPKLDGSMLLDRIKRVERTGMDLTFEGSLSAFPDRFIEVKIFPYPSGVGAIVKNLTERKIEERSNIEAKSFTEVFSLSTSIGYVKINIRGFPTNCSDSIYQMTGLDCDQICHARFAELFPVSERNSVQKSLEEALQYGQSTMLRSKMYSKGERDVDVELSIAPIVNDMGVSGALILTHFAAEIETSA